MTTLFFFICAVSVVFFGIFLVACLRPERKSEATPVVRKALPESQAIDAAAGRRFFVHLEEQMAHFISVHGRTAAILLIASAMLPLMARAQESSGPSADSAGQCRRPVDSPRSGQAAGGHAEAYRSVGKRTQRQGAGRIASTSKASVPTHEVGEQTAPASVPAESALAQTAPESEKSRRHFRSLISHG